MTNNLFSNAYQSDAWKQMLRDAFGTQRFTAYSTFVPFDTDHTRIEKAGMIGEILLDTDNGSEAKILVFEFLLKPNMTKLDINRVALANIIDKIRDDAGATGALAVFIDENNQKWRLTLVAEQETFGEETIATMPKRYTYLLGAGENTKTVISRFEALQASMFLDIKALLDAFAVEQLSKKFFDEYTKNYQIFCNAVAAHPAAEQVFQNNAKYQRDFTKRLLGRIVFLYFLQKKGWLGAKQGGVGNAAFVKTLFEQCQDKNRFYSQVLCPLFFDTLNNENRNNEAFMMPNGEVIQVPFLNGGLFEEDTAQSALLDFDQSLFQNLFTIFDQYNFTIDESSPLDHEIGIDPEMLGHIFENQLEDNKDKGAYYTPKQIVHYMCQESLIQYLQTNLKIREETVSDFVRFKTVESVEKLGDYKAKIKTLLRNVKICDPAIGSGAFPMGLLHEVFHCLVAIEPNPNAYELKKHIIRNSIYGVDIEKGAVDIARLRFWLSLVVDAKKPEPLPNLDYKIMQGNSLLECYENIDLSKIQEQKPYTVRVVNGAMELFSGKLANPQLEFVIAEEPQNNFQKTLDAYYSAKSKSEKERLHNEIDNYVLEFINHQLENHRNALTDKIEKAEADLNTDLKTVRTEEERIKLKTTSKKAQKIDDLYKAFASMNTQLMRLSELEHSNERPFFLWQLYFREVFVKGGFDIVIGNPPYIRADNEAFAKDRALITNSGYYKTLYEKWDIMVPFYERGLRILNKNGVHSFIVSNSITTSKFAYHLQDWIMENYHVRSIDYFENNAKIFNAGVVPVITFITPKTSEIQETLKLYRKTSFEEVETKIIAYDDPKDIRAQVFKKEFSNEFTIDCPTIILEDICYISVGIVTNADEKTDKGAFAKDDLISEIPTEIHSKRYVEGKDTKAYKIEKVRYFEWGTDRVPSQLRRPTFERLYTDEKIFRGRVTKGTIDKSGLICNDSITVMKRFIDLRGVEERSITGSLSKNNLSDLDKSFSAPIKKRKLLQRRKELEDQSENFDLRYLLGVINSNFAMAYLNNYRKHRLKNYFYPDDFRNYPIPYISLEAQQPFINIVNYLLFLNDPSKPSVNAYTSNAIVATSFEQMLNMMVYELYFETEMKAKAIDVLQFATLPALTESQTEAEQAALIAAEYTALESQANPIRNRIILANIVSADVIGRINQDTQ
jgi:hypothetical protein